MFVSDFIGKTPFYRLLVPVIAGIIIHTVFPELRFHWLIGVVGLVLILYSFFIPKDKQFGFRWIFGLGVSVLVFYLTTFSYKQHQEFTKFTFPETESTYLGTVLDIPEIKPRSVAINVKISHPVRKKTILYLQKTDEARMLQPGDEIVFLGTIQPFRNFGNPDDFDYEKFMQTKGFTGSSYLSQDNWQLTGRERLSVYTVAQQFRAEALDFYRSFELNPDAYAFISALTLGYKADLTDDLQEAFRASGTAHILAVSGLHVGIIYVLINLLFSFLGNSGKPFIVRQVVVIAILWAYAFITGMSVSVIRAAIMLSMFCIGNIFGRRGFTYNTLAAAAFLILIFRPFSFFEVGFQMSFGAVFAILFFQPKLKSLFSFKNKIADYIYDLFTVSVAAQVGVFPLVLYYFGTFPTYFFITNLLVVPLVGIIIYSILPVIVFTALLRFEIGIIEFLHSIFQWILKTLVEIMLRIVYVAETLPFAQLSDKYVTLLQMILLFFVVFAFTIFLTTKKPRSLIIALASIFGLVLINFHQNFNKPEPQFMVFNSSGKSEIGLFVNNKRESVELNENGFIAHPTKSILRLSDDIFRNMKTDKPFPVDILILSQNRNFNMKLLAEFLNPRLIVIDSSLPRYAASRIASECHDLGIAVHDVSQSGAFSVNY